MTHTTTLTRRHVLTAAAAGASLAIAGPSWAQSASRVLRVGHQKGWLSIL